METRDSIEKRKAEILSQPFTPELSMELDRIDEEKLWTGY